MKYGERTGSDCPKLGKLHSSYKWLKDGSPPPAAKSSAATATTPQKYAADPNYV